MRHPLLFLLVSLCTTTAAAAGNLQRHRILPDHKEASGTSTLTSDRLTPHAINTHGDECSCSPIKFTFRLALSQDCSTDDIAANVGIDSTFCIVEEIVSDAAVSNDEPIRRLQSAMPVEITSVQFLEFAPDSLEVMYTDDSYIETSLVDGDTVTFYSSSSYLPTVSQEKQEEYVPGGVSLILTGKTEDGSEIRNRFYWLYDEVVTDCLENLSTPGIYEGDAIGWIATESVSGPWPQFCPAESPSSPTINPRTLSPSSTPSLSPSSLSYGLHTHGATSSKSGKISSSKSVSKSSKNDTSSKAIKNSDHSGKSSKSIISYHNSVSMSMESPSPSPSESMSYGSTSISHDSNSAKSGKSDYDSKAGKHDYRVFSGKSSNEKVFSKSGKSSEYSSKPMSYSMSMPSTAPSESVPPSFATMYVEHSSKSSKAEADAKAAKYSSKSSKSSNVTYEHATADSSKGFEASSKSAMSYSMSMPSAAPSEPVAPTDDTTIDTKAEKYSAKAYRLMKPKSGKGQSDLSSKSSKGSNAEVSMSYSTSMPSTTPSTSSATTSSEKSSQGSISFPEASSKSSKSYHVAEAASMSYSMSMGEAKALKHSSKSSKGSSLDKHQYVRGLKSERTAGYEPTTSESPTHSKIDPDDEAAWAEYALLDAVSMSKSSKSVSSHQFLSMHSGQPIAKSLKEGILVLSGKNDKMSLHSKVPFSKSSKSDEHVSSKFSKADEVDHTSSKSSKVESQPSKSSNAGPFSVVLTGSKSSKSLHSYSYSLSMSTSYSSPKEDTFESKESPSSIANSLSSPSSSSTDTAFKSEDKESSPNNQIRSTNSSSSRSLVTAFVILILQFIF